MINRAGNHPNKIIHSKGIYENATIDKLFDYLNVFIEKSLVLAETGNPDEKLFANIRTIVKILFTKYGITNKDLIKIKYIADLVEKYSELNEAWNKADATGGHGINDITNKMQKIENSLNQLGLDNEGRLLKSLAEIQESVKKAVNM